MSTPKLPARKAQQLFTRLGFKRHNDGIYRLHLPNGPLRRSIWQDDTTYILAQYTGTNAQILDWEAILPVALPIDALEALLVSLNARDITL